MGTNGLEKTCVLGCTKARCESSEAASFGASVSTTRCYDGMLFFMGCVVWFVVVVVVGGGLLW